MAMAVATLALAVGLVVMPPSTAAAGASRRDVLATQSYLNAERSFHSAVESNAKRGTLAARELTQHLARECPDVASGFTAIEAKEKGQTEEPLEESFFAVLLSLVSPDLPAERRVAGALSRLHWSNLGLTALVHREARIDAATGRTRAPDLCGDLKEWAASGYRIVPSGTRAFLAQVDATRSSDLPQERIDELLRSYEGPRTRSLQNRVQRLRARDESILDTGVEEVLGPEEATLGYRLVAEQQIPGG